MDPYYQLSVKQGHAEYKSCPLLSYLDFLLRFPGFKHFYLFFLEKKRVLNIKSQHLGILPSYKKTLFTIFCGWNKMFV